MMKKAYLKKPLEIEILDEPIPSPQEGEVVIKVHQALTCGTDLKTYRRGHPKIPVPGPMGHEYWGTIHSIGDKVSPSLKVGETATSCPTAPCHHCELCQKGLFNLCPTCIDRLNFGAFSQYLLVPEHIVSTNLYTAPPHLNPLHLAFLEPLSCVVYALEQLQLTPKQNLLILGSGPIAQLFAILLNHLGHPYQMIARPSHKLDLAREFGAEQTHPILEHNFAHAYQKAHRNRPSLVIECTGALEIWQQALDHLPPQSTLLLYGGCRQGSQLRCHYTQLANSRSQLKGVFHYTPQAVRKAHHYLCQNLPLEKLISATFPLDQLPQAFTQLQDGQHLKMVIEPWS